MLVKPVATLFFGRWKQLIGGAVAALMLLPVPAMALTFIDAWAPVISTSGGPKPAPPTFSDVTNNAKQLDDLTVNMGNYQGSTATAQSSIELTRHVSVPDGSQNVSFQEQFTSQFTQAGASVTVAVKDASGHNVLFTPLSFSFQSTLTQPVTVQVFQLATRKVNGGTYTFDVKVAYNTNNKIGGWKTISPHAFEFKGL
jgi:hypothetical protein